MASPIYAQITSNGTYIFPLDYRQATFNANMQVDVSGATGATYHVDYTLTDTNFPPAAALTPTWTTATTWPVGSTTTIEGSIISPVAAVRIVLTGLSAGVVSVNILQGDFVGT
jgi:hypothetical protein